MSKNSDQYTRMIRIGRVAHQMATLGASFTEGVSNVHGYVECLIRADWEALVHNAVSECDGSHKHEALPAKFPPALLHLLRSVATKEGVDLVELCHHLVETSIEQTSMNGGPL